MAAPPQPPPSRSTNGCPYCGLESRILVSNQQVSFGLRNVSQTSESILADAIRLCRHYDKTGRITDDSASVPAVYHMACTPTFGSSMSQNHGFTIQLNPASGICREVVTYGHFCGCMVGMPVRLSGVREDCRTLKLDLKTHVLRSLQYACPFVSDIWQPNATQHTGAVVQAITGLSQLTATSLDRLTLDDTTTRGSDQVAWSAAIDPNGFVGLYERIGDTTPDDGFLLVCVRTIPAACELYRVMGNCTMFSGSHHNRIATYKDLAMSDVYNRILHLSIRNAQRLLYQSALSLGISMPNAMPDIWSHDAKIGQQWGLYPKIHAPGPDCQPISPDLPPRCAAIDALKSLFDWQPMLAIPTIQHPTDLFIPAIDDQLGGPIIQSVFYHNSTFHCKSGLSFGSFPSVFPIHRPTAGPYDMVLCPPTCASSFKDITHFDGSLFSADLSRTPPFLSNHTAYKTIALLTNQTKT